MLKEYHGLFKRLMIISDLCLVCIAFFLAFLVRNAGTDFCKEPGTYITLLPVLVIVWGILLYYFGMYDSFRTKEITDVLLTVLSAAMVGCALFGFFIFTTKLHSVSRMHMVYSFCFAALFLCIEKILLIKYFRYQRKKGINTKNIIIVGTGSRAKQFISLVNKHLEWGIKIIGLVDNGVGKDDTAYGYKILGSVKEMNDILHNNIVDEVLFVIPRSWLSMIEDILYICDVEGVRVSVAVDLFELKISKAKYRYLEKFPLLTFESTPDKLLHLFIKRLFDVVISGVALVIVSPILVIAAIMVKITSKGNIFFKQRRCSLNGRQFTLYKFRTMVENAESQLKELLVHNEMKGPVFKMKNDPRLTKVGGSLRKYSIDELPQLWNVFKGDMSLVGPRPPLPAEVVKYEPWQRRRLSMRPGITCLWQASGRNKITDFNEWMNLDLEYIDNWSLWLDGKILMKTLPVVMFGTGAK